MDELAKRVAALETVLARRRKHVAPVKVPPDAKEIERWRHVLRNWGEAVSAEKAISWIDALEKRAVEAESKVCNKQFVRVSRRQLNDARLYILRDHSKLHGVGQKKGGCAVCRILTSFARTLNGK